MTKFFTSERLTGLLILVGSLVVISATGSRTTAAWAVSGIVLSAYFGGLRVGLFGGLVASLWASLYLNYDVDRTIQVSINFLFLGGLVGWLKNRERVSREIREKARQLDAANGNLAKLEKVVKMIHDLELKWRHVDDETKRRDVRQIGIHLDKLASLVFGWHSIWLERQKVIDEATNE